MSLPSSDDSPLRSYRLIAEIGRGGMANVFLAVMRGPVGFNKLVVIKKTRKDLAIEGDVLAMFLEEARISARMNHPNVVQSHEIGQDGGQYYIAMEYLDGQPYSRVVSRLRGQLPLAMHLRVLADALAGLHHAHELCDFDGTPLSVVHRDATPQNVFITYDGSIKVVDFGIAKALDAMVQTSNGVVKGKVSYMSPEQARGERLDRRTDVFAAGVMLWEAIAGRKMWDRLPDVTITHELLYDRVPPIRGAVSDVPPLLSDICDRALSPDRERRYPTALAMAKDLERYLEEARLHASARDVGEHIAPAFEADRRRVREIIEAQLRDLRWTGVQPLVSGSDLPSIDLPPVSASPAGATAPELPLAPGAATVPTNSGAALPVPSPAPARSLLIPVTVGGGAAVAVMTLGAVLLLSGRARNAGHDGGDPHTPATGVHDGGDPHTSPSGSGSAGPAPSASAAAEPLAAVTLTVRAKPSDVRVYLDGVLVSTGPFEGKVARSTSPHTVRVEAEHHVPKEEQVTLASDLVLSFDLEKEAAPTRTARPGAAAPRTGGGRPRYGIEADSPYRR